MNHGFALVALALLGAGGPAAGQAVPLPEPPQQRAPWPAPANVPTNLLSAVETLCAQGFPDPRGCEYRQIEVVVSGVWAGNTPWPKPAAGCYRRSRA